MINCHSDTELHNQLIRLAKSSDTEFYKPTNPSVEPRHLPELSWLVSEIIYFRDVICIPSSCLSIRSCPYRNTQRS